LSDLWSRIAFEFSKVRWGQGHLREYLLLALLPMLALLLYQILFRRRRRSHKAGRNVAGSRTAWPGLDSEFFELEKELVGHGLPRESSEPLWAWLQRALAEPSLVELRKPLQELLLLHYRYRFDPRGLTSQERDALRRQVAFCLPRLRSLAAV